MYQQSCCDDCVIELDQSSEIEIIIVKTICNTILNDTKTLSNLIKNENNNKDDGQFD